MQTKSEMINRIAELAKENAELKALISQRDASVTAQTGIIFELKAELQNFKDMAIKGLDEFKDVGGCWGCGLQLQLNKDMEDIKQLKAENERLKEENYQLQKDCQICENFIDFIPCKPIRDMDYDLQKVISQRDNYYKTLQEIRDIASKTVKTTGMISAGFILQKITKAEEE